MPPSIPLKFLNKIRLSSSVEMDEAFFGGKASSKRRRGNENKNEAADCPLNENGICRTQNTERKNLHADFLELISHLPD